LLAGLAYDQSLGIPGDSKMAIALLEKGCADNLPAACYRLAYLWVLGGDKNLEENIKRAERLYRKACAAGLSAACYPERRS